MSKAALDNMRRERFFRIWDYKRSIMVTADDWTDLDDFCGGYGFAKRIEYGSPEGSHITRDFALMDATPMRDSKGSRIFEGDLVDYLGTIYVVSFSKEVHTDTGYGRWGWDLYDKNGDSHQFYYGGFEPQWATVVGHIFQVPEGIDWPSLPPEEYGIADEFGPQE